MCENHHLDLPDPASFNCSPTFLPLYHHSLPLGGAVAECSVARSLQCAIETDEMWPLLQTDLKEAIESVWTVMGYPEHRRSAYYNNEMHLFVPPRHTVPREDD